MDKDALSTLRVPLVLLDRCEAIARARRKKTGANCHRSEIAREAMEIGLEQMKPKT